MARLILAGGETGYVEGDGGSVVGGTALVTSPVRSGGYAYNFSGSAVRYLSFSPASMAHGRWYRMRAWFRRVGTPTSDFVLVQGLPTGGTYPRRITLNTLGQVVVTDTTLGVAVSDPQPTVENQWFCVEFGLIRNSGVDESFEARINGTSFYTATLPTTATNPPSAFRFGQVTASDAAGFELYGDDFAVNDDQGTGQTSWPGARGQILALLPASDSAIGSSWTLGAGGAPGGVAYESVNNRPPTGKANGTAANGDQIRDTASGTSSPAHDADFACQTPTAAGVPAGATVTVAQVLAYLSDSASGTSINAALVGVSNPAIASTTVATGTTNVAADFPSGWSRGVTGFVYNPTISLTTAPVIRIGKRTNSASVALLASFAALQIEYELPTLQVPLLKAPAVKSKSTNAGVGNSAAITGVTGIAAAGRLGLLSITGGSSLAVSAPAGWTEGGTVQSSTFQRTTWWWRRFDGTETDFNVTLPTSQDFVWSLLVIEEPVAAGSPVDVQTTETTNTATPQVAPSVSPVNHEGLLVVGWAVRHQITQTPPAGMAEQTDRAGLWSSVPVSLMVATEGRPQGATGTRSSTWSTAVSPSSAHAFVAVLKNEPEPELFPPTVTSSLPAQTLSVPLLTVEPELFPPTVAFRSQTLTIPLLTVEPQLLAPAIVAALRLTVPLLDVQPTLFAPSLEAGIVVPLLDVAPQLFAPSLNAGAVVVAPPLLDVAPTLFVPVVRQRIVLPLFELDHTFLPPEVFRHFVGTRPGFIGGRPGFSGGVRTGYVERQPPGKVR